MGNETSRTGDYMKLTSNERTLIKQIWMGIENNPQSHGSVFFMGFCEIYPQYMKYFSLEPRMPLSFDSRTNVKFTIIMETMGYLLLDFHKKPKQLDQIIGYIAMVHKDMNLDRSDMFNFGVSLVEYLSVTFPTTMTPECLEVTSKYIHHLLDGLSRKIERFKNGDILEKYITQSKRNGSCGEWLFCRDSLIYGQTLEYWTERKNKWDKRLNDWKSSDLAFTDPIRTSSTDEEEIALNLRTEDESSEFAESTARLLESHGIPRKTKKNLPSQKSPLNAPDSSSSRRLMDLKIRRPVYSQKMRDETVQEETVLAVEPPDVSILTPRERRRIRKALQSKIEAEAPTSNIQANLPGSSGRSIANGEQRETPQVHLLEFEKSDSSARSRRRKSQERTPRTSFPSVYF